jgi:hypothetical protein
MLVLSAVADPFGGSALCWFDPPLHAQLTAAAQTQERRIIA